MNKILRKVFIFIIVLFSLIGLYFWYVAQLFEVKTKTIQAYKALKKELVKQGYKDNLLIISGKRYYWENQLLTVLSSASQKSKHLSGEAIDMIVLDVNGDNQADSKDVDIVYQLLDKKIIGNQGGIGTYKKEWNFFSKQMVHFDCRGYRARWK